jgi:two-component system sensor histidine kinase RegB
MLERGGSFGLPGRTLPGIADASSRQNLILLIQLRWIAVAGQIVTIVVVQSWLGIALPLAAMFAVIGALVLLNVGSLVWLRGHPSVGERGLLLSLILDVAALTAQLSLSGGATNPFIFLYILQVTLAAVLLRTRPTVGVVLLTCACFVGVTVYHRPIALPPGTGFDLFGLYIDGLLVCFALDAALLVAFVTRITRNLSARDAHLAALRQRAAEEDHIVRMGLLASGAAHELGTPLSSLSVILGDWRRMPAFSGNPELAQELGEMQAAVQRCKSILTGILLSAGEARGEAPAVTTVNHFLDGLAEDWRTARAATVLHYDNAFGDDLSIVSDPALQQVLFNVLDNAYEASPRWVSFTVERREAMLLLRVADAGPGFAPEMLAQLGRPYNSSKGRAGGGLGLFLVVNVVRKLGGSVVAANRVNGGAVVTIELPLETLTIEEAQNGR